MKAILNQLFDHRQLTRAEARDVLMRVSNGEMNDAQLAALLGVFILRNISAEELAGFREAMLELCIPLDLGGRPSIDLCGTGGDGKNTFNVSTLAAFVVAGSGYAVTKHGNYGVSSVCGSSNVLEHLGVKFTADRDALLRQLDAANICFLHAPLFHPAMKGVAPIRKALGVKTFFNLLGPLVNPAQPSHQLIGVFNLKVLRLYQLLHQTMEREYTLVHSLDGYDEISMTGGFRMISPRGERLLEPEEFGVQGCNPEDLFGGDTVPEAAALFTAIITGNGTPAQNHTVCANAAAAIHTFHPERPLEVCFDEALETLSSGKAQRALDQLVQTA